MLVHELAGHGVVSVALGLGAERPDHLRMAVVATLADVDIAPRKLQRIVRLEPCDGLRRGALEEQRDDLHQPAHGHHCDDQHDQQADLALDYVVHR